ncbi:putative hemerythrin-like protein C869,06c [Talaromyces islandicus]|uniref:Putative hemerythrin-like protein C869,06c n=1 Tax=Talaromyces islandicus TaxID=28573 RepID=A0A0U1M6H2_TALIS|nr:putative hemerythrin-like protein C869,06c [Talaromyces islandicus]
MSLRFRQVYNLCARVSYIQKRQFRHSSIAMAAGIIDTIKHDHRELESYYDRIVGSSDADEQTRYQNQFTWELARHSIGEELVVYPALERYVNGGVELARKDREEHQKVKEQLKEFQNMTPSDERFLPIIKALMADLAAHIKEEESEDLPRLEAELSREESEGYSKSFSRTKMFVPSRSHPSAPDKPPYETAVGLLTAPIDHLADLFRKWPDTAGMPNPSTK